MCGVKVIFTDEYDGQLVKSRQIERLVELALFGRSVAKQHQPFLDDDEVYKPTPHRHPVKLWHRQGEPCRTFQQMNPRGAWNRHGLQRIPLFFRKAPRPSCSDFRPSRGSGRESNDLPKWNPVVPTPRTHGPAILTDAQMTGCLDFFRFDHGGYPFLGDGSAVALAI